MQHHKNQPHISLSLAAVVTSTPASSFDSRDYLTKRRGSYTCSRCGLPKKGHVCHIPPTSVVTTTTVCPPLPAPPPYNLRRALSFDDADINRNSQLTEDHQIYLAGSEPDLASVSGGLPVGFLWEVLRRFSSTGLLAAASVCKGWRDATRQMWILVEELRLRVPTRTQIGFVNSMLQKCQALVRLNLRMERLGLIVSQQIVMGILTDLGFND